MWVALLSIWNYCWQICCLVKTKFPVFYGVCLPCVLRCMYTPFSEPFIWYIFSDEFHCIQISYRWVFIQMCLLIVLTHFYVLLRNDRLKTICILECLDSSLVYIFTIGFVFYRRAGGPADMWCMSERIPSEWYPQVHPTQNQPMQQGKPWAVSNNWFPTRRWWLQIHKHYGAECQSAAAVRWSVFTDASACVWLFLAWWFATDRLVQRSWEKRRWNVGARAVRFPRRCRSIHLRKECSEIWCFV